jgi:DNA repair exonuclease SbcCD nuclease subunit
MVRILHTADWHRGAPSAHPIYQQKTLPEIIKLALDNKCDYILIVGDIFDKPNPDQKVKDELVKQLLDYLEYDTKLKFIFTLGNHDYTTKAKIYHSLHYLALLKKAISMYAPDGENNIYVLSPGDYLSLPNLDVYVMKEWGEIRYARKNKPLVLTWHGLVPGMSFSKLKDIPEATQKYIVRMLNESGAKYIALGDIHRCMKVGKRCWYSGPPVQKAYSDKDGVLIVKIIPKKIKIKKHRLNLPKKITLEIDFEEGKSSEESLIEFVKEKVPVNQLLKLKFELPLSTWSSLDRVYIEKALQEHCLELKLENNPIPEVRARRSIDKMSKAKTIEEEIGIILKEEDFGLRKKKLKKICLRYV